jgi:hypothetical protein
VYLYVARAGINPIRGASGTCLCSFSPGPNFSPGQTIQSAPTCCYGEDSETVAHLSGTTEERLVPRSVRTRRLVELGCDYKPRLEEEILCPR